MDHSMMDHSQSPSSSMDSMGDSSGNMMMTMQMWFQASTSVTLWFKEWQTDSHGKYAGSIIGLILLCLLQEIVARVRTMASRRVGGTRLATLESGSSEAAHPEGLFSFSFTGSHLLRRTALSLLYALNLTTSYLLMLAVMTFNIGYFLAIVFGLAFGHFLFAPSSPAAYSGGMLSEACCPQS